MGRMPRPNPVRLLASEESLARRVAYERERREWSTEGLARRMTDVGCPIHQSAIWKIENGKPPRRITVDELVAFSRVFDVSIEELLLPVDAARSKRAMELVELIERLLGEIARLSVDLVPALREVRPHLRDEETPTFDRGAVALREVLGVVDELLVEMGIAPKEAARGQRQEKA
jgi:transcriptional regulator with XRE-family HTH domain